MSTSALPANPLGGHRRHPLAPPEVPTENVEQPTDIVRTRGKSKPEKSASATDVAPSSQTSDGAKKPLGIRGTEADSQRIRAAYMATNSAERWGTYSDFAVRLMLNGVKLLEDEYNGGEPWHGLAAGEIPTGRPLKP